MSDAADYGETGPPPDGYDSWGDFYDSSEAGFWDLFDDLVGDYIDDVLDGEGS